MPTRAAKDPVDFIVPLNMNGLSGRMLRMPPPRGRKREILFVYGHHSTIERWSGLIQVLNRYGAVTVPDLPGFGGMESLYKIGREPTVDALADYLAAFIKLRYKKRRITIAGLSFGFVVVTRMLQRYPDIAKQVDLLVSVVGFAHRNDFVFSRQRYWFYVLGARFFSWKIPAFVYRHTFLLPSVLQRVYYKSYNAADKFRDLEADEFATAMEMEIALWHRNDVRTHFATNVWMLRIDNCQVPIDLPLWHVSMGHDRYFDEHIVEQHLRVIFKDVTHVKSKFNAHAPSVIADAKEAAPLIPMQLRRELNKR